MFSFFFFIYIIWSRARKKVFFFLPVLVGSDEAPLVDGAEGIHPCLDGDGVHDPDRIVSQSGREASEVRVHVQQVPVPSPVRKLVVDRLVPWDSPLPQLGVLPKRLGRDSLEPTVRDPRRDGVQPPGPLCQLPSGDLFDVGNFRELGQACLHRGVPTMKIQTSLISRVVEANPTEDWAGRDCHAMQGRDPERDRREGIWWASGWPCSGHG